MSDALIEFMRRNGIDLEWYHPLRWYTLSRFNHRTHRKLMVIDGALGFSGGLGIADEWLGDADSKGHWRETVAQVEGPVVTQMQSAFMDNWIRSRGELLTGLGNTLYKPGANFYRISRTPDEAAETFAQLFLGVRVQCAKCHNHPFESITQTDY